LQALRAQMNPHFIFNALNSIQSFYANNDELTANKFMTTFSSLIRQILISSSKNLITIKDEIDMLTNYIELEKMRFKGKFDYRITLDKEIFAEKVYLPIMLIQPYVENAIHHGLRFGEDGLLSISFALDNKSLICTIEDNGIGLKASLAKKAGTASGHISAGMQITHDRIDSLNIIYEGRIGVSFIDRSEKDVKATGLTVRISLPVIDQNIQEL
ncbi:MAG: hypothetical protein JWO03_1937, partial [Bacteroidetes bacterium]|nr:hypothetical protein [Bacteroidota bacterium]